MTIRDIKAVIYTADDGTAYQIGMDAALFGQAGGVNDPAPKVGGADYTGSPALPPIPRELVPRHVMVSNTGNKRKVVCLESTAGLFTAGGDTTVTLQLLGTTAATYTKYKAVSEHDKRHSRDPSG